MALPQMSLPARARGMHAACRAYTKQALKTHEMVQQHHGKPAMLNIEALRGMCDGKVRTLQHGRQEVEDVSVTALQLSKGNLAYHHCPCAESFHSVLRPSH